MAVFSIMYQTVFSIMHFIYANVFIQKMKMKNKTKNTQNKAPG